MNLNKKKFLLILIVLILQACKSVEVVDLKNESGSDEQLKVIESKDNNDSILISNLNIYGTDNKSKILINMSIDEFNKKGYEFGDSVDIEFSNGFKLEDIPYYDGYYDKKGGAILLALHSNSNIMVTSDITELWKTSKVKDSDTVKISRRKKGKYKDTQNLWNIKYTNNRNDYSSDEVFVNFRNIKVGNLKTNILYREASPIDNYYNRAKYVDKLIKKVNINYDIDLSDDEKNIKIHFGKKDFDSPYFKSLYQNSKVCLKKMIYDYKSKDYANKVVQILMDMSKNDGPYYVHCVEGKDRTGFLCIVITGLAGAKYEEIVKDYMITYDNYYGINEIKDRERYNKIKEQTVDDLLRFFAGYGNSANENIALNDLDWNSIMGRYLLDNGMSLDDLDNLYDKLIEKE